MAHTTTRALPLLLFFLLPLRLPIAVHRQGLATAILARMEGVTEQPGRLGPKSQEDGDTSHRGDLHPILDARVVAGSVSATGATTARTTGAPRQAKPHGAAEQGQARQKRVKRAILRATRRAQLAEDHTTLYRGRRLTLAQLGGPTPPPRAAEPRTSRLTRPRGKRIRLLTKNVGGLCSVTHDVFMTWLTGPKNDYDIVLLQETHYGLGKTATEYRNPGLVRHLQPGPAAPLGGSGNLRFGEAGLPLGGQISGACSR